jgi:protein subunit release factor B
LPAIDRKKIRRETTEEFLRVRGPGGQHRNRNETGVRLRHRPTGIVVVAVKDRSQARNRAIAWKRLFERIAARMVRPKKRVATKPTGASRATRLDEKRARSSVKTKRRRPSEEE